MRKVITKAAVSTPRNTETRGKKKRYLGRGREFRVRSFKILRDGFKLFSSLIRK